MPDNNKKGEVNKGFAGLTSLLSDVEASVDTTHTPLSVRGEVPPTAPTAGTADNKSQSSSHQSSSQGHESKPTYQSPPQVGGVGSGGKWIMGLGVVALVIWGISQMGNKESQTSSTGYSTPATTASPSTGNQPSNPPSLPSLPPVLTEEVPSAGSGNVLGAGQIRYCLAEDIRLTAAKQAVNEYNNSDIDRFNSMVADYNSRCSNFRYRRGALESVRSEVERHRLDLESEGRTRFVSRSFPSETKSIPTPAPNYQSPQSQDVDQVISPPARQRTPSYKGGPQCTYSTECSGANQCLDGQCRPPRASGESCIYSSECAGANQCLDGQCRASRTAGDRCTYSSECSGANQCLDGQCRPARSSGERCAYSSECSGANQCLDGQCRAPRVSGERCAFSSECGGMNECVQGRCQRPQ